MSAQQTQLEVPEHVTRLAGVMSTYTGAWALCGGWAVDAWLGEETRVHGDIDIVVFHDDIEAVREHFTGWELVAHPRADGDDNGRWSGEELVLPAHIHAPAEFSQEDNGAVSSLDGFSVDIQVCERRADDWVLTPGTDETFPLERAAGKSPWGITAVVPEILLFYKAIDRRRRDERDFQKLLPRLSADRRSWLREAISRLRHPWLERIAEAASID